MSGQDPNRNRACTDERNIGEDGCERYPVLVKGKKQECPEAVSFARLHAFTLNRENSAVVVSWFVLGATISWNLGWYRSWTRGRGLAEKFLGRGALG